MAEVAFEGFTKTRFHSGLDVGYEWGLDGWTSQDVFELMLTTEFGGAKASLDVEQCVQLMTALSEHVMRVNATEKNIT